MADSVFLDEVVGFLHNIDDPTVSGAELLQSLDKEGSLLSFDTDIALQLLDVTPIDGLFSSSDDDHHSTAADSDCTSVDTESVASSASPRATLEVVEDVRSRDAIRRSTYRKKQKAQKADLYQQVEELSTQLTELQNKKDAANTRRGLGLAPTALWQVLANRHLQARLLAEEHQRRLREAVERRSALICDLGVIIRKRISEGHPDGDNVQAPSKRARVESPDMALYDTFIKEMDDVYARTDSMFRETDVEASPDNATFYNASRTVTRNSNYHELVGMVTTPFPFERVRSMVNQVRCMENRPGCEKIQVPGVTDETNVLKFRIEARVGMAVGSLVQHAITRRYNEADRIVVVWRKFTEGEGIYAGMHSDETGWNVIRPVPSWVEGAGTCMESIIRYVPMTFNTAASADGKLKEFTDTIIAAGEEDCQACVRKLEGLLLDDALGVS
ncbi:hypothetical protein PHYPSEUDO_002094 [Phytophthora pseudosyringae]|uniref:M96 mating-specific protein family n=1 Tax=Phytophthora pseudosyringae TaxID=221518 RepID=A0A8T1VXG3_9STRA|nr:hypothetical protein PHYPSEUDO_002094 [Phytophthora pseudosyringae]